MAVVGDERTAHEVLFAAGDAELVALVGSRIGQSLAAGAAALVIATPEHRTRFTVALRDAGHDPDAAAADGSLVLLDAAETLTALAPGGSFDRKVFDRVLGSRVRALAADRRVDAFGELLPMLWEAGRVAEAIELERAWEALVRETSTALLCAYPIRLVDDDERASQLRTVCGLHGRIVPGEPLDCSWRFEHDLGAGSRARRVVADILRVRGVAEPVFYDVLSVLTELVGSALRHSRAAITVDLAVEPDRVEVRVGQEGTGLSVRQDPAGGVGLRLVDELADRWSVDATATGQVVRAEIRR